MTPAQIESLSALYEQDETAWLEAMAELAAQRRFADMDFPHLSEYLSDMARRDRREVYSRVRTLLQHLLKWEHEPDKRTGSWRATLCEQRSELRQFFESRTLRNHAQAVLARAYHDARKYAADETGLPLGTFPAECAWDLDALSRDE
jgi:hypothetical protein